MAAAGIDASNVERRPRRAAAASTPTPRRARLRAALAERTGAQRRRRRHRHRRPGLARGPDRHRDRRRRAARSLDDHAGRVDAHGNELAVTAPAVADEIAGAAELAQGKLGGRPVRRRPRPRRPGAARRRRRTGRRRAGAGRGRGPVRATAPARPSSARWPGDAEDRRAVRRARAAPTSCADRARPPVAGASTGRRCRRRVPDGGLRRPTGDARPLSLRPRLGVHGWRAGPMRTCVAPVTPPLRRLCRPTPPTRPTPTSPTPRSPAVAKKSAKTDRQAVIDEIRKKQKGAEQRRGFVIVGVCVVVAAADRRRRGLPADQGLVGPAGVRRPRPRRDRRPRRRSASEIDDQDGRAAARTTSSPAPPIAVRGRAAGVRPRTTTCWAAIERKFYTAGRPPRGRRARAQPRARLHDPLVRRDDRRRRRRRWTSCAASPPKFTATTTTSATSSWPCRGRPRTATPFPDGPAHRASPTGRSAATATRRGEQVGVWQYCSEPSGEALEDVHEGLPLHRLPRAGRRLRPRPALRSGRRWPSSWRRGDDRLTSWACARRGDQQRVAGCRRPRRRRGRPRRPPGRRPGTTRPGAVDGPHPVRGRRARSGPSVGAEQQRRSESKSPTSSQPNVAGHDGHPAGGGGRLGDRVVDRDLRQRRPQLVEPSPGRPRSPRSAAAKSGSRSASRSSSTVGRTTNMPAFHR